MCPSFWIFQNYFSVTFSYSWSLAIPLGNKQGFSTWGDVGPCLCAPSRAAGAANPMSAWGLKVSLAAVGLAVQLDLHPVAGSRDGVAKLPVPAGSHRAEVTLRSWQALCDECNNLELKLGYGEVCDLISLWEGRGQILPPSGIVYIHFFQELVLIFNIETWTKQMEFF